MHILEVDVPDPGSVHGDALVSGVHGDVLHGIVHVDVGGLSHDDIQSLEHHVVALHGVADLQLLVDQVGDLFVVVSSSVGAVAALAQRQQVAGGIGIVSFPASHQHVVVTDTVGIQDFAELHSGVLVGGDLVDGHGDAHLSQLLLDGQSHGVAQAVVVDHQVALEAVSIAGLCQHSLGSFHVIGVSGSVGCVLGPCVHFGAEQSGGVGQGSGSLACVLDQGAVDGLQINGGVDGVADGCVVEGSLLGVECQEGDAEAGGGGHGQVFIASDDVQHVFGGSHGAVHVAGLQSGDTGGVLGDDLEGQVVIVTCVLTPVVLVAGQFHGGAVLPADELVRAGAHQAALGGAQLIAGSLSVSLADDVAGGGAGDILPGCVGGCQGDGQLPVAGLLDGCHVVIHPAQVGSGVGVLDTLHGVQDVFHGHSGAVGEGHVVTDLIDVGDVVHLLPAGSQHGLQLVLFVEDQQALGDLVDHGVGGEVISESGVQLHDIAVQSDGEGILLGSSAVAGRVTAAASGQQGEHHGCAHDQSKDARESVHFLILHF